MLADVRQKTTQPVVEGRSTASWLASTMDRLLLKKTTSAKRNDSPIQIPTQAAACTSRLT